LSSAISFSSSPRRPLSICCLYGDVEDVFGDRELGAAILNLERRNVADARDALGRIIAERYIGEADVVGSTNR
jgi:hypothetical protein